MTTLHFDAGRYALYLWPAYGISAVTLLCLVAQTLWRARQWRRRADAAERAGRGP